MQNPALVQLDIKAIPPLIVLVPGLGVPFAPLDNGKQQEMEIHVPMCHAPLLDLPVLRGHAYAQLDTKALHLLIASDPGLVALLVL